MEEAPRVQPSNRFVDAVGFAAEVHRNQSRKGSRVPYLAHLLAVASLVLEDGGDEDEAMPACSTTPSRTAASRCPS